MDYAQTLPETYGVGDYRTNYRRLTRGLGSFWTSIFADKEFIKGYTIGMAEELIQSYYNLVETVASYSVHDIPILHRERWLPVIVKKSELNLAPFRFAPDGAVFGTQPELDVFYAGKIFQFGYPKDTSGSIFSVSLPTELKSFSIIADRVLDPTVMYLNGVDAVLERGVLYLNSNPFDNAGFAKSALISDFGAPITFVDKSGVVQADEFIILWLYNAGEDTQLIQNNFGTIFELKLESSDAYKKIMEAAVGLCASGPTVKQVAQLLSALMGVDQVRMAAETLESSYTDTLGLHVITDKSAYLFDVGYTLASGLAPGTVVHAGDQLVDAILMVDAARRSEWWTSDLAVPKLGLPNHMFVGNYKYQLFFSTALEPVSVNAAGDIVFPVEGRGPDVAEFHKHMNLPANKEKAKAALGLTGVAKTFIKPVDFLFANFFKNNTTLLKLKFLNISQFEYFFGLNSLLRKHLPAHVYLLYLIDLGMPQEHLDRLNSSIAVEGLAGTFAADGSTASYAAVPSAYNVEATATEGEADITIANSGEEAGLRVGQQLRFRGTNSLYTISNIVGSVVTLDTDVTQPTGTYWFDTFAPGGRPTQQVDPDYYRDYTRRLFCVAQCPTWSADLAPDLTFGTGDTPLHMVPSNIKLKGSVGTKLRDGALYGSIPTGATTKEVSTLLLIDFS